MNQMSGKGKTSDSRRQFSVLSDQTVRNIREEVSKGRTTENKNHSIRRTAVIRK